MSVHYYIRGTPPEREYTNYSDATGAPERNATLAARAAALIARSPSLGDLRRRLLGLGGDEVVLAEREFDLEVLLGRGCLYDAAHVRRRRMRASSCHRNASALCIESRGVIRIATGYALSDDGLWRQHSWCIDKSGGIIETTVRRVQYYGYTLVLEEAALFIACNLDRLQDRLPVLDDSVRDQDSKDAELDAPRADDHRPFDQSPGLP
jgi:hypothetical protein